MQGLLENVPYSLCPHVPIFFLFLLHRSYECLWGCEAVRHSHQHCTVTEAFAARGRTVLAAKLGRCGGFMMV